VFFIVGELTVFLFEGLIYKKFLKISWKQAFIISFGCNFISVLIGKM